jgi:hypothetical protein
VRDEARKVLLAGLEAADLEVDEVGEDKWMTMLSGEWKRTIPLLLHLDEHSLKVTSLFAGVPDEGHEEVYRLLLQRNQRPQPVHFALDDEGDLIITGMVPWPRSTPTGSTSCWVRCSHWPTRPSTRCCAPASRPTSRRSSGGVPRTTWRPTRWATRAADGGRPRR